MSTAFPIIFRARAMHSTDLAGGTVRKGSELFNSLINSAILQKGDRLILIQLKCDPVRRPHYFNLVALMRGHSAHAESDLRNDTFLSTFFFSQKHCARTHTTHALTMFSLTKPKIFRTLSRVQQTRYVTTRSVCLVIN